MTSRSTSVRTVTSGSMTASTSSASFVQAAPGREGRHGIQDQRGIPYRTWCGGRRPLRGRGRQGHRPPGSGQVGDEGDVIDHVIGHPATGVSDDGCVTGIDSEETRRVGARIKAGHDEDRNSRHDTSSNSLCPSCSAKDRFLSARVVKFDMRILLWWYVVGYIT